MKVCPHQEVALCCSLNFVVCLDDENGNGDVVVLSMANLRKDSLGTKDNLESEYREQFQDSQAPRPVPRPRQQFSRAGVLSFSSGHHLLCCHSHYQLSYHHNLHCHLDNQSSHFLVTNSRTQARSGDIARGETGTSASKEDQVRTQFEYCCLMDRLLH